MNSKISLKIDIQTILKMAKFNNSFRYLLKNTFFFTPALQSLLDSYIQENDLTAKSTLWGMLSVEEHIPEVNSIIDKWRKDTKDSKKMENMIEMQPEAETGHNVIGKIIEFDNIQDKYKKLVLEEKRQRFEYNGFKVLPSKTGLYQLFY